MFLLKLQEKCREMLMVCKCDTFGLLDLTMLVPLPAPWLLLTTTYNPPRNVCSSIYFWQKQFTDMSVTKNDQLPTPLSHCMNQNIAFDNLWIYQNRVMIVSKLAKFMHCSIHPPDSSWKIDCRSDCWAMGPLLIEIGFQISCLVSPPGPVSGYKGYCGHLTHLTAINIPLKLNPSQSHQLHPSY